MGSGTSLSQFLRDFLPTFKNNYNNRRLVSTYSGKASHFLFASRLASSKFLTEVITCKGTQLLKIKRCA